MNVHCAVGKACSFVKKIFLSYLGVFTDTNVIVTRIHKKLTRNAYSTCHMESWIIIKVFK